MTISFVRECQFLSFPCRITWVAIGAASFTIYSRTKEIFRNQDILCRNSIIDVSLTGGISGAMSGALISFCSARMYLLLLLFSYCILIFKLAFELVKVRPRRLHTGFKLTLKRRSVGSWNTPSPPAKGLHYGNPQAHWKRSRKYIATTVSRVCTLDSDCTSVCASLAGSWKVSFEYLFTFLVRDTAGTALYFLEYDGMRHLLGRQRSGEQGTTPAWLPIHSSLVPFVCGSLSGVCSRWSHTECLTNSLFMSIGNFLGIDLPTWRVGGFCVRFHAVTHSYTLSSVKTKVQQRALAGELYRGPWETLYRLVRGMFVMPSNRRLSHFLSDRSWPPKSETNSVGHRAHLSRIRCERAQKYHDARPIVDPFRLNGTLHRQSTTLLSQGWTVLICAF